MEVALNALEQSLHFQLQRCGVDRHRLNDVWTRYPCAVIGQPRGGRVRFQVDGGMPRRIPVRGAYVIPTNARVRAENEDGSHSTYHWAHIRFTLLGAIDLFQVYEIPLFLPASVGDAIGDSIEEQVNILRGAEPYSPASIARRQELGFGILRRILAHARLRDGAAALISGQTRIQPALDFMQARLADAVTRADLARCVHLSESRFHDTFRRATGYAPLQYLQLLRLRHAQELLLSTDLSVSEVGRGSGFADPFHFSRQFKSVWKQSPRQYREAARKGMYW
jgi:AraC-like DNA-binding protein